MNQNDAVLVLGSSAGTINEQNYAQIAEQKIRPKEGTLAFKKLTTSKLRGIYSLIMNVYTRINTASDFESCQSDLQYIKVKMAYESGRDRDGAVKEFIQKTGLMEYLDSISTYEQFILYCRYAESLVAYFKFYGGRE